jgi:DNA-binding NarL/FixJ family response regulator
MSVTDKIRILSVDDHPLMREGIAAMITRQEDMLLVGEATNGQEAIESFRVLRPDVTLMDLQMPGINGIDAIIAIRQEFADARIIVLTTFRGDAQALRAFRAGAAGYLLKGMLRQELLDTIRMVHGGGRSIPPEIAAELAEHITHDALSDREVEVLKRVASGTSNKIIASQLQVSEATIKSHMKSILAKLHASDRTHAVTIAMKRGFIDS